MILDATTRKIQVLTDAAATTTESPVVADFVDFSAGSAQPITSNTITNGTSAVDIVAAPASGFQRRVTELSIENADTVNHTYTVRYNDNATTRIIVKILLLPGQTLMYGTQTGWVVPGGLLFGGNKGSFRANKNGTDQTGIVTTVQTKVTFTTEVWDTGGYYDAANSKWTPPAGPVALVGCLNYSGGVVTSGNFQTLLYKNGSLYANVPVDAFGNGVSMAPLISFIDLANGTDFYEIYALGSGTGNKTVSGATNATFFGGTCL